MPVTKGYKQLVDEANSRVETLTAEQAVKLAGDPARIAELRATLRDRIRQSPLGDPEGFAGDFYAAVATAGAAP